MTFYYLTRLTPLCWGPRVTRSPSCFHTNTPTPSLRPREPRGWGRGVTAEVAQRTGLPAFRCLDPATEVPGTRPGGPSLWLGGEVTWGQERAVLGPLLGEAGPESSLAFRGRPQLPHHWIPRDRNSSTITEDRPRQTLKAL